MTINAQVFWSIPTRFREW